MGTSHVDYDDVTDPNRLKYADEGSILPWAKEDLATVTLTNGGSF